MPEREFDDFLALREADFSAARLVVFCGRSGSGKSTAIRFLLEEHRDFQRSAPCAVLDELISWRDLLPLMRLLRSRRRVVAAAHLPAWIFRLIARVVPSRVFVTDSDPGKLARHLARRGISCCPAALAAFCKRYRATYTDLEIVLEAHPHHDFAKAWGHFERFWQIDAA